MTDSVKYVAFFVKICYKMNTNIKEGFPMAKRSRYKDMERGMTILLIASALDFILFLVFAGMGILWLKVITAIFAILMPVLCLFFLFLSRELLKQRSLWITMGFFGILICTIVSLIVNYPSPVV